MTHDMMQTVMFYKQNTQLFFDASSQLSRLVYFEEYNREAFALRRFNVLKLFTRQQKERLIRAVNTDWIDLSPGLDMERMLATGLHFGDAPSIYHS